MLFENREHAGRLLARRLSAHKNKNALVLAIPRGAVAVASPGAARAMSREADAVVCLNVPAEFYAVGQFFRDFSQVSDEEVEAILQKREAAISAVS